MEEGPEKAAIASACPYSVRLNSQQALQCVSEAVGVLRSPSEILLSGQYSNAHALKTIPTRLKERDERICTSNPSERLLKAHSSSTLTLMRISSLLMVLDAAEAGQPRRLRVDAANLP